MIIGVSEWIVILVVVVFFYGGKRLAQVGEGLGKSITEFKKAIHGDSTGSDRGSREPTKQERS